MVATNWGGGDGAGDAIVGQRVGLFGGEGKRQSTCGCRAMVGGAVGRGVEKFRAAKFGGAGVVG